MLKKEILWSIRIVLILVSTYLFVNIIIVTVNHFRLSFSGETFLEKEIKLENTDISEMDMKNIRNIKLTVKLDLACPNYSVINDTNIPLFNYPYSIIVKDNNNNILLSQNKEFAHKTIAKYRRSLTFSSNYGFKKLTYYVPLLEISETEFENLIINIKVDKDNQHSSIMNKTTLIVDGNFEEYDPLTFIFRFSLFLPLLLISVVICVITFRPGLLKYIKP